MIQHITYSNAKAEVFSFTEAGDVQEHHVMLHVTNSTFTFQQQLDAILDAYQTESQHGVCEAVADKCQTAFLVFVWCQQ